MLYYEKIFLHSVQRGSLSLSLSLIFLLGKINFSSAQNTELSEPLQSFSILSGASVTSDSTTNVKGSVGAVGTVDTTIRAGDTTLQGAVCVTQRALDSLTAARSKLAATQPAQTYNITLLRDTTLTSGTRNFSSSLTLSDTITLTGDSSSVFIFNINGSLTFDASMQLVLVGGVKAENVFFNVDSSVFIGDSVVLCGNVLCDGTISCMSNCYLKNARLLSADSVNLVSTRDTVGFIVNGTKFLLAPQADAGKDTIIFVGQSVQIGSTSVAGVTYSWSPSYGLDNPNVANPIASPSVTTSYMLTVTDTNGCTAMDTAYVNAIPPESVFVNADVAHDSIVRIIWDEVLYASVSKMILEKNIDSIHFASIDSIIFPNSLINISLLDSFSLSQFNLYKNIFYGTEVGYVRFVYNDIINDSVVQMKVKYRVKIIAPNGSYAYSKTVDLSQHFAVNQSPITNFLSCPSVGTPPLGTVATGNSTTTTYSSGNTCCIVTQGQYQSGCNEGTVSNCNIWDCECACQCTRDPCCQHTCATIASCQCGSPWTTYGCVGNSPCTVWVITNVQQFVLTVSSSPNMICYGQSVTLTASGGFASYSWTPIGLTDPSVVVSPQTTTTYTVIATGPSGCTVSAQVTVTVFGPMVANFQFVNEQCMNQQFTFTNTTTSGGLPFTLGVWDFGDGTPPQTLSAATVSYTYNKPGEYLVTLTASNVLCCSVFSQIVRVTPSVTGISGYNPCCCSSNFPYNINDFTTLPNLSTVWNPNLSKVKETIRVVGSSTLTITSNIQFGPWGKIIVEPGGTLILNGTYLSGISCVCNINNENLNFPLMWQGIEVWGDPTKNHSTQQSSQGKLIMSNGATITDAHNAVTIGRFCSRFFFLPNCFTPPPTTMCNNNMPYDLSFSGGILLASGCNFQRNANNIRFAPYNFLNMSKTENCSFNTFPFSLLDPGYLLGNSLYQYHQTNDPITFAANPNYAKANGTRRTNSFAHLWDVRNVRFIDNTFNNAEFGINIYNAQCRIIKGTGNGNTFQNLSEPISAYYAISTIFGNVITDNQFISTQGVATVQIHGGKYDWIKRNVFNIPVTSPTAFVGIWMDNSSGFSIMNNKFRDYFIGTAVGFSFVGGGTIGNEIPFPSSFGNIFTECKKSIYTYNKNFQLKIQCNNTHNPIPSKYQTNWDIYSTLANQGINTAPAGNKFDRLNFTNPKKDIKSNNSPFDYWRHNLSYVFPGNPQCVIPVTINSPVTINVYPVPANEPQTFCDPPVPCPPLCTLRVALESQITQLQNEFNTVLANLDYGQTLQLLAAINGNTSNGNLKNMLLQNSPLSDEVLTAFINKNGVPPGHLKDVVVPNSPLSNNIHNVLDPKLSFLPPGISNQIKDAQANQSNRTLTAILRDILYAQNERQILLNGEISQYVQMDSVQQVINLLETENTTDADHQLIAYYLDAGDLISASVKLNSMTAATPEEQKFIDLYNFQIALAQQDRTVFDMDSSEIAFVRNIAEVTPTSLAAANAQAILKLVFNEDFQFPVPSARMQNDNTDIANLPAAESEDYFLGDNIPNPFSNQTAIPYYLPKGSAGNIKVYDINGKLLQQTSLKEGGNILLFNTENWQGGIYYYNMEADDKIISTKKMVLIK